MKMFCNEISNSWTKSIKQNSNRFHLFLKHLLWILHLGGNKTPGIFFWTTESFAIQKYFHSYHISEQAYIYGNLTISRYPLYSVHEKWCNQFEGYFLANGSRVCRVVIAISKQNSPVPNLIQYGRSLVDLWKYLGFERVSNHVAVFYLC